MCDYRTLANWRLKMKQILEAQCKPAELSDKLLVFDVLLCLLLSC